MDSRELLQLSQKPKLMEYGFAPWFDWKTENAGYGVAYRKSSNFPSIFPIFATGDHGVPITDTVYDFEDVGKRRIFLTSYLAKALNLRNNFGINAIHIKHPWIEWRTRNLPSKPDLGKGTLVFYPHSNASTLARIIDQKKYFSELKELPDHFQPITICLMSHDIMNHSLHEDLNKLGLTVTTAGNTSSRHFIKRFYDLIDKYEYFTSPNIGSHFYYLVADSKKFFFHGQSEFIGTGKGMVPRNHIFKHGYKFSDNLNNEIETIMRKQNFSSTLLDSLTKYHVESRLGYNSAISYNSIRKTLYFEMLKNIHSMPLLYLNEIKKIVKL